MPDFGRERCFIFTGLQFIESVIAVALWPAITWLLLAPQRRAVDKDHTRPI